MEALLSITQGHHFSSSHGQSSSTVQVLSFRWQWQCSHVPPTWPPYRPLTLAPSSPWIPPSVYFRKTSPFLLIYGRFPCLIWMWLCV